MKLRHTLVFIRHGETDWNVEHRLQGQQDIPLNDRGRLQARRNGETLLRAVPDVARFEFVTSPLVRARETMEILRAAMGLSAGGYRIDPGLKEITFGEWEGFTLAELSAKDAGAVVARESDKWGYQPPRGESYAMLSVRIRHWLESVERDTVAVSHGAVSRVIRGLLEGLRSEEIPLLDAPQDRFLVVRPDRAEWH
jgi:probable phosphoglycerate mutase